MPRIACWAILFLAGCLVPFPLAAAEPPVEFNRDIRPILSNHCYTCHGPDKNRREADLRLDTEAGLFEKLESGSTAIVPRQPAASELLRRITASDPSERMPPVEGESPLTPDQIATLRRWIEQGARWQGHWSLIPPKQVAPPVSRQQPEWAVGAIDRFILARLESEGLTPSPAADRTTLIRRLSFDLTGLPPTPAEVAEFVNDQREDAYDRLVTRLLDSPHYGERMAIPWLDVVRFADTVGYHGDQEREVWAYRDYVIGAFNRNLPFDQFTIEQLAGDLLPNATVAQRTASGYNMLNMCTIEGGAQAEEYLAKYAADRVRTTATAWLGATLGCAECHDHKFDPYSTKDFYQFAAFFADLREKGVAIPPADLLVATPEQQAELDRLAAELAALKKDPAADKLDIASLTAQRAALLKKIPLTVQSVSVAPRTVRVLPRGNWLDKTGEVVEPGVPHFMPGMKREGKERATRLDLARWLVADEHPLTARVVMNRLWKQFFGRGISRVLDDLGSQGEWPDHPELLDWLAVEFVESGWDMKRMVRLIVSSNTYRQSSLVSPELAAADPDNRLLARQSRYRLPAELVRDNALAVSGLLVRDLGGPSVRPYQPDRYYQHLNFPTRTYRPDMNRQQYRRGVYMHWQRTFLHPMLLAFDAPQREECAAERPQSNTPLAALTLLNDPTFVEAARALAARVASEGGETPEQRIVWLWREVLSRSPNEREQAVLAALFEQHLAHYTADAKSAGALLSVGIAETPKANQAEIAAWTGVARAVLNLSETITRN